MVNIAETKWSNFGSGLEIAIVNETVYLRFNSQSNLGISETKKTYRVATSHGNKKVGILNKETEKPILVGVNAYFYNPEYKKD